MQIIQPQFPGEYQMEREFSVRNLRTFGYNPRWKKPLVKVCLEYTRKIYLSHNFQLITAGFSFCKFLIITRNNENSNNKDQEQQVNIETNPTWWAQYRHLVSFRMYIAHFELHNPQIVVRLSKA